MFCNDCKVSHFNGLFIVLFCKIILNVIQTTNCNNKDKNTKNLRVNCRSMDLISGQFFIHKWQLYLFWCFTKRNYLKLMSLKYFIKHAKHTFGVIPKIFIVTLRTFEQVEIEIDVARILAFTLFVKLFHYVFNEIRFYKLITYSCRAFFFIIYVIVDKFVNLFLLNCCVGPISLLYYDFSILFNSSFLILKFLFDACFVH